MRNMEIDEGFLVFLPSKRKEYISYFPSLKEKQKYRIFNCGFEEKITDPPNYLTEAELI